MDRMNQCQDGWLKIVPPAHKVSSSGCATTTAADLGLFQPSIELIFIIFACRRINPDLREH
jgi:hypothetical protein